MKAIIIKHLKRRMSRVTREQKGATLLDTVIGLALLGAIGVFFLSALPSSALIMASVEKKVDIDSLARAQMEYTKDCTYIEHIYGSPSIPPDYATLGELSPGDPYAISIPAGYSINITANSLNNPDDGIQQITVTVSKDGVDLLSIEDYKVNR